MAIRMTDLHDDPIVTELCRSGPFTRLMKKTAINDKGEKARVGLPSSTITSLMAGLPDETIQKRNGNIAIMKAITGGAMEAIKSGWTFNEYVRVLDDRNCHIMQQFRTEAKTLHPDSKRRKFRAETDVLRHLMSIWSYAYTELSDRKRPERVNDIRREADERLVIAGELIDEFCELLERCDAEGIDTGLDLRKNDIPVLRHYIDAGRHYGYYHPVMPVRTVAEALFGDTAAFKRVFLALKNLRSDGGGNLLTQIHRGTYAGKASGDASVYQLNSRSLRHHIERLRLLLPTEPTEEKAPEKPLPNPQAKEGNRRARRGIEAVKARAERRKEKERYRDAVDIALEAIAAGEVTTTVEHEATVIEEPVTVAPPCYPADTRRWRRIGEHPASPVIAPAAPVLPARTNDPASAEDLLLGLLGDTESRDIEKRSIAAAGGLSAMRQKRRDNQSAARQEILKERRKKTLETFLNERSKPRALALGPGIWMNELGDRIPMRGPARGQSREDFYLGIAEAEGWDAADDWWRGSSSMIQLLELELMPKENALPIILDSETFAHRPVPSLDWAGSVAIPPSDADPDEPEDVVDPDVDEVWSDEYDEYGYPKVVLVRGLSSEALAYREQTILERRRLYGRDDPRVWEGMSTKVLAAQFG